VTLIRVNYLTTLSLLLFPLALRAQIGLPFQLIELLWRNDPVAARVHPFLACIAPNEIVALVLLVVRFLANMTETAFLVQLVALRANSPSLSPYALIRMANGVQLRVARRTLDAIATEPFFSWHLGKVSPGTITDWRGGLRQWLWNDLSHISQIMIFFSSVSLRQTLQLLQSMHSQSNLLTREGFRGGSWQLSPWYAVLQFEHLIAVVSPCLISFWQWAQLFDPLVTTADCRELYMHLTRREDLLIEP